MSLASIGIVAGCAGAIALGRLLTSLLYGLPARDPLTLVGAAAVLALGWQSSTRRAGADPCETSALGAVFGNDSKPW
jgi:hypothetical protein